MIGALAGLLLAGQAPAAVPFELGQLAARAEALDGRWVEFTAFVYLMGDRDGHALLAALTGNAGRTGGMTILCADDPEASAAIMLRGRSLGPLSRAAARPDGAYVGVRVRGILRNRTFGHRAGGYEHEWPAYFDQAQILRVTGGRCALRPRLPS